MTGNENLWFKINLRCLFTKSGLDMSWCHDIEKDIHLKRALGGSLKSMSVIISFVISESVVVQVDIGVKIKSYHEKNLRRIIWITLWTNPEKKQRETSPPNDFLLTEEEQSRKWGSRSSRA